MITEHVSYVRKEKIFDLNKPVDTAKFLLENSFGLVGTRPIFRDLDENNNQIKMVNPEYIFNLMVGTPNIQFVNDIIKEDVSTFTNEEYGKYFKVVSFESWYDADNAELLDTISNYLGQSASGVPYIIIGDQVFGGYASDYDEQIKTAIKDLYDSKEKYDVFEEYNKSLKKAAKAERAVYDRIIIWNFVFVVISTAVIMFYVNKSNKKLLEAINNSKETVKIEKLDKRNDYRKSTKKVVKKNHEEV